MLKIPESKRPKQALGNGYELIHDGEGVALYNGDLVCREVAKDHAKMTRLFAEKSGLSEDELDKGLQLLEEALSAVTARLDEWPKLEPLPELLEAVKPFDFDLLPGVLRGRAHDITNRMQCPPDFVAVGFTITISSLVGYQVGIRPKQKDDWLVVPNLYGMNIGRPGVLKTPALDETMKDLRRLELSAKKEYEEELKEYDASIIIRKTKAKLTEKAIAKAISAKEEKEAKRLALNSQKEVPEEVRRSRFVTNDVTVEKLGELLADSQRCILIYRDELSGFLRTMDREDRSADRAFYLEAWGGTGTLFTYDRIGRGTIDIDNPCVAILGSIQPGPLQEYIAGTMRGSRGDDGLLQRFQLAVWPDVAADWKNVDEWPDKESKEAVSVLFDRLASLNTEELGAEKGDYDTIPYLRFDKTTQGIFDDWRATLERRVRSGDCPPAFEAHLAKYRSLVPAIALLCHLIEGDTSGAVREESLLRALAWTEYLETHAARIYAYVGNVDLAAAKELHRHIVKGDLGRSFSARAVYRKGWSLLDKDRTARGIEYLEDFGHIRKAESQPSTGRPSVEWAIHPDILAHEKSTNAPDMN